MSSPTPTFFSPRLAPRITPPPQAQPPEELVVEIYTTLVIQNFEHLYHGAALPDDSSFYTAIPDGTLLAAPYLADLRLAFTSLMVTAIIATLFARNIIVCIDYLRRANVKRRTLFYLLLLSQLLSFGLVPVVVSFFYSSLDCTTVLSAAGAATGLSLALLMSGVLGLKAYRCLENSRIVLSILILFFGASSSLLVFHLENARGHRRLSAGCSGFDLNPVFLRAYVFVQLAHSFFLSCCFFLAVWRSRGSPAARGRLSCRVSFMDDEPDIKFGRRTWWNQLLGRGKSSLIPVPPPPLPPAEVSSCNASSKEHTGSTRPSTFSRRDVTNPIPEQPLVRRPASPVPSRAVSSILRFIPRVGLFHEVMKDELLYTTTITFTTFILALCVVLASKLENCLDIGGWLELNASVISVLVIHSFGRVVRRHERDVLLQSSAIYWPENRSPFSRRVGSPQLRFAMPEDRFSDVGAVPISRDSLASWSSDDFEPKSPIPAISRAQSVSLVPSPFADPVPYRGQPAASFEEKSV
uniref:Uncharacterized protein n=1 Tax=Mycena chlorophos TaxID=658473 RepID=A0ABQ0L9V6_MYCCL|nr:predicted protein [Mycena chlorophos]